MTDHLNEAAIQQYVLEEENCPAWMTEHLKVCERCSVRVNNYRLIFKEVGGMAPVEVEVDISRLMPMRPVRTKKDWSMIYWLASAGVLMLVAGWFFRAFLLDVAGDLSGLILYVLVGVSVGIAIVRGLGLIVQYRNQLKNLDLS